MASINVFPSEVTPLVRSISEYDQSTTHQQRELACNSYTNKVVLSCFLGILLMGTFCGFYLLSLEGGTYEIVEKFDFVTRKEWGVKINQTSKVLSVLPFTKVLLIQMEETKNLDCNRTEQISGIDDQNRTNDCKNEISLSLSTNKNGIFYGMEKIWYNFYVNSDGTIFEGRGFYLESFCEADETCSGILTLGIKGIKDSRSSSLAYKIKAFLDYSISRNILNPCFEMIVKEPVDSRDLIDIAFWIKKLNKKMRKAKRC